MRSLIEAWPQYLRNVNLPLWVGGLLSSELLVFLVIRRQFDLLFAVVIAGILSLATLFHRSAGILLILGYMILMGDVRRVVSYIAEPTRFDLLLLIAPVIAGLLAIPILLRARLKEPLSKAVLALFVIMILGVFNPLQGGLVVGLAGALFYIAPMFWFWIGRNYASPILVEQLLNVVILPLSCVAAVIGLLQTYIGFLPWEDAWIDMASRTYVALHVGSSIRPFGFSVSAAEYATTLALATAAICGKYLAGNKLWAWAFPLLFAGVVLASGRSVVIKLIVTVALLWPLRKIPKITPLLVFRLAVFSASGLMALGFVASHFTAASQSSKELSPAAAAINHLAAGLSHPFDRRYSTAGLHGNMIVYGLKAGFTNPLGRGLGSTTLAASKLGNDPSQASSELDITDMFLTLGLPGGLAYLCIVFFALRRGFFYLKTVPSKVSLPVLGMLLCTVGSWLIGGQYSTSSIMFFLIGATVYQNDSFLDPKYQSLSVNA
jgi:hypothetical protein